MGNARGLNRKTSYVVIGTMVWVVCYNFGLLSWLLGLCNPTHKFFYADAAGSCKYGDVWKELSAWSGLNVFTDFLIFFLPLPMVWQLQMPLSQKLGVVFTLATGLMVCVATIVNMVISIKIIRQQSTEDPLQLWAIIEMNIGLVCVCLPAMKQLLSRSIPFLSRSFGSGKSYESGGKGSASNGQSSGNRTPGRRATRVLNTETDGESASNIRLTHEMKQFEEQQEFTRGEGVSGNPPTHGFHFADMGERAGFGGAKDSEMGMSTIAFSLN
ncbi:hypothetical protein MMC28_011160 [Mycoblastus sanguinarius]|nr:hypothetical protein [Mycoblastus sanguinarius]